MYWLSLHFSKGKCITCVASCLHGGVVNWCTLNGAYSKEHYPAQYTQVITKLWHTGVFNGYHF